MNVVHNDTKLELIPACPGEANTEDKCVLCGIHIVYISSLYRHASHDFCLLGEQRGSAMDSKSDQDQGSSPVFSGGSQGRQEPCFFPSCSPSQGSLFLASWCPLLASLFFTTLICSAILTFSIHSAKGIKYTMPFASIIPGLSFTFVRDFQGEFPWNEGCLYTQWPACSADLLAEDFDVWHYVKMCQSHHSIHSDTYWSLLQMKMSDIVLWIYLCCFVLVSPMTCGWIGCTTVNWWSCLLTWWWWFFPLSNESSAPSGVLLGEDCLRFMATSYPD